MDQQQPPRHQASVRTRLIVQTSVSLVLVVAIFYYLLRGIDLRLVWAEIRAMSWTEDAVLALIGPGTWPPTPLCGCRSPRGWALGGPW